uniref:TORC_C domain-containing protein n=1 Tax=Heterorhabditis bacteriophora TaxID=37862 RepID=A0A1I7XIU3_HETBA
MLIVTCSTELDSTKNCEYPLSKHRPLLPDILFDPLSELENCEVLPLSSLPEQQILDDGMQKSSTDTDGFMGMGNLMDQIVHDGVMDINRLDNILFSPPTFCLK